MINWQTKKLGEVLKLEYGKPLPKSKRVIDGKYPVYGANGEKERSNDFYFDKPSIMVGRKGSAGELNLTEEKFWPLDVTYFVTFDEKKYDLKFLYDLLVTLELPRLAKGVKPGLNRNEVYSIEVEVPELPEQKQIVKILDEVFEKVTKAKASAEKNLQNTKDLFESYLQSVFANPGKDWEERTLREMCDELSAGGDVPKGNFSKTRSEKYSIPIFANGEKNKGLYGYTSIRKIVKPSITVSARGTIGYSEIRREPFFPIVRLIVLTPNEQMVDLLFLYYIAHNFKFSNTGTSIPQLTIPMIENIKIALPPLKEQRTIVKKLDTLFAETKKLEKIYEQKLDDLEELKKSVLKQAFSGELVKSSSPVKTVEVAIPSPYILNQVHAAIIEQVLRDNGSTTEVAVAKYDHLLQEVWGLSLGYQFQTHQFGPFDAQIKKLVSSGLGRNRWFTKRSGMIVFGPNAAALLSRQSNLYRTAQSKMQELARLGITKLDAEKVELLSTICHSIKEVRSTNLDKVRDFMSKWATDGNRTKADKFSSEQTQKCLDFVIKNDLHLQLL